MMRGGQSVAHYMIYTSYPKGRLTAGVAAPEFRSTP
jgi:hypothetical protein